jgi:hypothetical protein
MFLSRRHTLLGAAALLAGLPTLAGETSSGGPAPVAAMPRAQVKCLANNSVPMTSDAEQALPYRIVRALSCGENVAILSDDEGYTARVRAQDGKEGYVARLYLSVAPDGIAHPVADLQPSSATPVNGVVRWHAGAAGCEQFASQGHLIESVTADGITVQVSLDDTGWKFRTSVAVSNNGDSAADISPALLSLDELQPGLKLLRIQDPRKLAHAKNHQVLWTLAAAQPSPSAVAESSANSARLQNASYHPQDYFASQANLAPGSAKGISLVDSNNPVALSLKAARLQPGQKTIGVVWFERDANARELSLRVLVGDLIFDFPLSFDQER